ncbi:MAG: hypothetical protein SF053_11990 [Bacteroidia bacterium]|nr:hypothetical protein [Bacteroidia bacterium]
MNPFEPPYPDESEDLPVLNSLPRREIFSVPEGYFDDLADKVRLRAAEAGPETPVLDSLAGQEIYQAPAGYFETLPGRIQALIQHESRVIRPLWSRMAYIASAAAAVVLLILAGGKLWTPTPDMPALAQIPTEALVASLEVGPSEEYLILDALDEETVNRLHAPASLHPTAPEAALEEISVSELEELWEESGADVPEP